MLYTSTSLRGYTCTVIIRISELQQSRCASITLHTRWRKATGEIYRVDSVKLPEQDVKRIKEFRRVREIKNVNKREMERLRAEP